MVALAFAAAGVALKIVSMIPEGISLVNTPQDKFAPPYEGTSTNQDTVVRVHLGSQEGREDVNSLGGDVPGVALWDMSGQLIGSKEGRGKKLRAGTFEDITITARKEVGNVQAHYLAISGGDDAICVAGVTINFPDGAKTGFDGNIPVACGAPWANSQTSITQAVAGGGKPNPTCVWIDGNGSNGLPYQGFGVHLPSFGSTASANLATSYNEDSRLMCKSGPRFRMYDKFTSNDPILVFPKPPRFFTGGDAGTDDDNVGKDLDPSFIIENPGIEGDRPDKRKKRSTHAVASTSVHESNDLTEPGSSKDSRGVGRSYPPPSRRAHNSGNNINFATSPGASSTQPTKQFMYNKVIVSPNDYNSAKRLCESETSWGQSFVSLSEGLFCDMQDKTLYYTCDNNEAPSSSSCCYDTTKDNLLACTQEFNKRDGTMNFHMPISSLMMDIDTGTTTHGMVNGKIFTNVKRW